MQPNRKLRRAVVAAATAMLMTATAGCTLLARNGDDAARVVTRSHPGSGGGSKLPKPSPGDLGKAKDGLELTCELYKASRDPEQFCP